MQGFVEAKMLAKKFASLYYLLEDLLSPQKHYDWGLRAIKSVLVVAGSLLRAEEGQLESNVLFRALRDLNIAKILAQVIQGLREPQTAVAYSGGYCILAISCGFGTVAAHASILTLCMRFVCKLAALQDMVIFMGLLNDLFPGIDPPRKHATVPAQAVAK
jgi:hypothetical protein